VAACERAVLMDEHASRLIELAVGVNAGTWRPRVEVMGPKDLVRWYLRYLQKPARVKAQTLNGVWPDDGQGFQGPPY
jgi:hypothetical protein